LTKWAFMNGNFGCMPDNFSGPYEEKAHAVEEVTELFQDDISEAERDYMVDNLWRCGAHYFSEKERPGADYVEIIEMTEEQAADLREEQC
jgi:hypothetical protein